MAAGDEAVDQGFVLGDDHSAVGGFVHGTRLVPCPRARSAAVRDPDPAFPCVPDRLEPVTGYVDATTSAG